MDFNYFSFNSDNFHQFLSIFLTLHFKYDILVKFHEKVTPPKIKFIDFNIELKEYKSFVMNLKQYYNIK